MLHRRSLLPWGTLWGLILYAVSASAIEAGAATAFVKQFSSNLVDEVNGMSDPVRQQADLRKLVERTVDIDGIGHFCLGRYATEVKPDQMQEFSVLFHQMLVRSITSKIGAYNGVKLAIGRASPIGLGMAVSTIVQRPGNAPNTVQWLIYEVSGESKISDVIVEGTSLRLTQRAEFEGYLLHHDGDVASLLTALRARLQAAE